MQPRQSLFFLALRCAAVSLGSPHERQGSNTTSYRIHLTRDPTFGFLGNISLGVPSQQITAFIDWTWISLYVVTGLCDGQSGDPKRCLSPQQPFFNQLASTSYESQSSLYPSRTWNPNEFFGNIDFRVDYASDIAAIGPVSSRITLQASDLQPGIFTSTIFPFSGILGLSPVFRTDNASTQSPFYQLWRDGAYPTPYTAFAYCYKEPKLLCNGYDGIQTLGGYDAALVPDGLTWYPIVRVPGVNEEDFPFSPKVFNYWALPVTQLSLGDQVQALNYSAAPAAIFDYASKGRGAPLSASAYANLVSASNATAITLPAPPNNGAQSFHQVDCDTVPFLPPIRYRFGAHDRMWEIIPTNYVETVRVGVCVLNVRVIGEGSFAIGNFGETFAKDKYIVFDFEQLRVGLGEI